MIVRLAISVEGYTELEFCREVLKSHLLAFGVNHGGFASAISPAQAEQFAGL